MSLITHMAVRNPETGLYGEQIRPITEGEKVEVVAQEDGGNSWGWLDGLKDASSRYMTAVADAYAQNEARRITGAESTVDSTGMLSDQPGGVSNQSMGNFFEQNKKMLLIGGGALALLTVVIVASK